MSCSAVSSKSLEDHLLDVPCHPRHVSNQMFRQFAKLQNLTDFEIDCIARKCGNDGTNSTVSPTLPVSTVSSSVATSTTIPIPSITANKTVFLVFLTLSTVLIVYTLFSILVLFRRSMYKRKRARQSKYIPNVIGKGEDTSVVTLRYTSKTKSDMIESEEETSFLSLRSQETQESQKSDLDIKHTLRSNLKVTDANSLDQYKMPRYAASRLDPNCLKS